MRQPPLAKWEIKKETNGFLFFGLLVEELLFDYTIDTFKIPALNTKSICEEVIGLIDEVENGSLQIGAIYPVLDELSRSMQKDLVVREILKNQFNGYLKEISDKSSINKIRIKLKYLINKIEKTYFECCKNLLKEKIKNNEEKEAITKLTRIYINELISNGYSPEYIYFESNKFFFSGKWPIKISSPDIIDDYFNLYKGEIKKWNVLFRVTRNFGLITRFVTDVGIVISDKAPTLKFSRSSRHIDEFLSVSAEHPMYLTIQDIQAHDVFKARQMAEDRVALIHGLVKYHIHRRELYWRRTALVYSEERDYYNICKPPLLLY